MSSWRVGAETAIETRTARPRAFDGQQGADDKNVVTTALDRLTKWIPGDVLALYVAAVTAFAAKSGARPSPLLLVVFIVLSAAFVIGGAFAATGEVPKTVLLPSVLAAAAFTIWSLSVPFSGWQRWSFVSDNQAAVAIVAAIVGLLFGFAADGFTKRANREQPQPAPAPR
jgi:hypothetical protein